VPVGTAVTPFTGTLNGLGNTISNLKINRPTTNAVGLIGYQSVSGMITNVGLLNPTVAGHDYVGSLVGYNYGGTITSSYADNVTVTALGGDAGGLVGRNDVHVVGAGTAAVYTPATLSNSYVNGGVVTAAYWGVGGLAGSNNAHWSGAAQSSISGSYVRGATNVYGPSGQFGPLVGNNTGLLIDSRYDIDNVLVGTSLATMASVVTQGGLYNNGVAMNGQFNDWLTGGKTLNIANYSSSLVPAGGASYTISGIQGMKDLLGFAENSAYTFTLGANIDLTLLPGYNVPVLAATFDGANNTVSNLNVNQPYAKGLGLFSHVLTTGAVSNVGVIAPVVNGYRRIGGLAGWNEGDDSFSLFPSAGDYEEYARWAGLSPKRLNAELERRQAFLRKLLECGPSSIPAVNAAIEAYYREVIAPSRRGQR